MYVPAPFRPPDASALEERLREDPFATLCAVIGGAPVAVHIPLVLDRSEGSDRLIGHAARQGPFVDADGAPAVAIFAGPQGYVSPSWYASKREHGRVVPTWDYLAVHATGTLRVHDDPARLLAQLRELTDHLERDQPAPWSVDDAPAGFVEQTARAVIGLELEVERFEGQFKLSQNRSEQDLDGVLAGLQARGRPDDGPLADHIAHAVGRTDAAG